MALLPEARRSDGLQILSLLSIGDMVLRGYADRSNEAICQGQRTLETDLFGGVSVYNLLHIYLGLPFLSV